MAKRSLPPEEDSSIDRLIFIVQYRILK